MSNRFDTNLETFVSDAEIIDRSAAVPAWEKAWVIDEPNAKLRLAVRTPIGSPTPYYEFNIDYLRKLGLQSVLVVGLVEHAKRVEMTSVATAVTSLKTGFSRFLHEVLPTGSCRTAIDATAISPANLSEFAKFLRKGPYTNSTRKVRAGVLKSTLHAFLQSELGDDTDRAAISIICKTRAFYNLVADSQTKTGNIRSASKKAEKFLSDETLYAIINGVEHDVVRISTEWKIAQKMIFEGKKTFDAARRHTPSQLRSNLALCLAWVDARYPEMLPTGVFANSSDKDFYNSVFYRGRGAHGLAKVRKAFYATPAEILPFVLLLLLRTRYNLATVLNLKWTDILDRDEIIVFTPFKGRSNKIQVRSEVAGDPNDPLSMRSILTTLDGMTKRIRASAPAAWKSRVFLAANSGGPSTGNTGICLMHQMIKKTTEGAFGDFCVRHQLDPFNAASLRPTLLNAIIRGSEGLAGGQREGNHSDSTTTLTHYTSIQTSDNRRITLAEASLQTERWATTQGRMDPRFQPSNADLKAATPGFGCIAPFESPIEDQVPGRLCRAVGHCARCPNVFLRSDDPVLVAYALAYAMAAAEDHSLAPDVIAELLSSNAALFAEIPKDVLARAMALPKPDARIS